MKSWYLLRCQENTWRRTLSALSDSHVETCCPLQRVIKLRSDKKNSFRQSEIPIFPGYIFAHFDPETIHTTSILKMYGARDFIRFGKDIATVPGKIVNGIKLMTSLKMRADVGGVVEFEISECADIISEIEEILTIEQNEIRVSRLMKLVSNRHYLQSIYPRGLHDKNSS